jgi:hypothetical protein
MLHLERERSIKLCKYKGVFDVRLSQGKIEHPTFLKKRHPNGYKTKIFGFVTIRTNIHTCFVPITNNYKTSLSIFNFTLKLITCSMLPLSTVGTVEETFCVNYIYS